MTKNCEALAQAGQLFEWIDGGVCAPLGFRASGIHAGFRKNATKRDLALVVADEPCSAAATFTQNVFCAAPVRFSKKQLEASSGSTSWGTMQAIAINSGNANAATGAKGMEVCVAESELVACALSCSEQDVLIASTGVIGVQLPLEPFKKNLGAAVSALSRDGGRDAAEAIMTTDTTVKECAVSFEGDAIGYPGCTFKIGAMAKGSGMIMPNMATMISVITTDVPMRSDDLYIALKRCIDVSFNKVTVDSDTSTNDTCFIMASGEACAKDGLAETGGAARLRYFEKDTPAFNTFENALAQVCVYLAREMASDGEGATRLVDVVVNGAATSEEADLAARSVANSPLVKTAVAGRDANWGRIAAALGKSGAHFNQENVDISIMGIDVCKGGLAVDFDEDEALRRFENQTIEIVCDLGAGDGCATVWTCDLTHDYIHINADYRS